MITGICIFVVGGLTFFSAGVLFEREELKPLQQQNDEYKKRLSEVGVWGEMSCAYCKNGKQTLYFKRQNMCNKCEAGLEKK